MEDVKKIKLRGKYARGEKAVALVDADTHQLLLSSDYRCYFNFKRIRKQDGQVFGYVRCVRTHGETKHSHALHHIALGITELPDGMVVDHINGDTLDNRRANLRLRSLSQNALNRKVNPGRSQHRGVRVRNDRFIPVIKYQGLVLYLWRHHSLYDAARIWDFLMLVLDPDSISRHTNFSSKQYEKQVKTYRRMLRGRSDRKE